MLYLVINREGVNDAINGAPEKRATPCLKTEVFDIASSIKDDEIILIWDEKEGNSFPLWVINDKVFLETLAYIDTYVKKYTPFTSFYRAIPLHSFLKEILPRKKNPVINTDILIGIVIAEAHLNFDRSMERENGLPIQAYLSTLSASIIYAINCGYAVNQISEIVKNWKEVRALLSIESDDKEIIDLLNFWDITLSNLGNNNQLNLSLQESNVLPSNLQKFLSSYKIKGKITEIEWKILANGNDKLLKVYSNFTGTKESGIENLKILLNDLYKDGSKADIEVDIILAASLSILSSGSIDYLSLALSISKRNSLVVYWYVLFSGMHEKQQIFKTGRGVGSHIKKHLTHNDTLYSKVTSDISHSELKVIINNKINIIPFITQYSTVVDVEIFPLVRAKFNIKRNSNVIQNETREGVFIKKREYFEITEALSRATKILEDKYLR